MANAHYLVFVGAALSFIGAVSYIRDTLTGHTKPNRLSWLLISFIPLIAVAASLSKQLTWSALPIFMSGFIPLIIFVASFFNPNGYWRLGKTDWVCGGFSLAAIIAWALTKEPVMATVLAIAGDGLACVPIIVKSYKSPHEESFTPFALGWVNASTTFFALKSFAFVEWGFAAYLISINTVIVGTILIRRAQLKSAS